MGGHAVADHRQDLVFLVLSEHRKDAAIGGRRILLPLFRVAFALALNAAADLKLKEFIKQKVLPGVGQ